MGSEMCIRDREEAENFGTMSNAQKILFLEEKGEVMGYGKSEE